MKLKEIGELIKRRREFLNLRQEDLSALSKITIKTIHLVEQGSGNPSFETLSKLSEVLGLEIVLQVKRLN
jgi:transcriptional regulator with XRE-family HTH domain